MTYWHFSAMVDGKPVMRGGTTIEIGKWYTVPEARMCETGFHGSRRAIDALYYAPGSWVSKRKILVTDTQDDKVVGTECVHLAGIDATEALRKFYDQWGSVCYLVSAEIHARALGNFHHFYLTKKRQRFRLKDLDRRAKRRGETMSAADLEEWAAAERRKTGVDGVTDLNIDAAALRDLDVSYVFSAIPIHNAETTGLRLIGSASDDAAAIDLYVYSSSAEN